MSRFEEIMSPEKTDNILPQDGEASFDPGFLSKELAESLFEEIHSGTHWKEETIKIYGREVMQPRLMSWVGDPGTTYTYSGSTFEPESWPKPVLKLRDYLKEVTSVEYNSALLNLYRDGLDSMGAHSDDEPELGTNPTIASISLGETRKFVFRHRQQKLKVPIELPHGSLLVMSGVTQKYWKHELPKVKKPIGPRINLTFRRIISN